MSGPGARKSSTIIILVVVAAIVVGLGIAGGAAYLFRDQISDLLDHRPRPAPMQPMVASNTPSSDTTDNTTDKPTGGETGGGIVAGSGGTEPTTGKPDGQIGQGIAPPPPAAPQQTEATPPATAKCGGIGPGFLLPFSSMRLVQPGDLAGFDRNQLRIARNEIYARHGFRFHSDLQFYFACKPWYHAQYDDVTGQLSPLERQNIVLIQRAEGG
jgi:hypothetical protein